MMTAEEIRSQILALAKEYYRATTPDKKRSNYVPASGKKLGEEELSNMIEASLDMWLTAGRFNDEFEKNFAEKLANVVNRYKEVEALIKEKESIVA